MGIYRNAYNSKNFSFLLFNENRFGKRWMGVIYVMECIVSISLIYQFQLQNRRRSDETFLWWNRRIIWFLITDARGWLVLPHFEILDVLLFAFFHILIFLCCLLLFECKKDEKKFTNVSFPLVHIVFNGELANSKAKEWIFDVKNK